MNISELKGRLQDLCRTSDELVRLSERMIVPDQNQSVDYYKGYRDATVGIANKLVDHLEDPKLRTHALEFLAQRLWDWRDKACAPEDLRQDYETLLCGVPDRRV
jgi:hypothetical protein